MKWISVKTKLPVARDYYVIVGSAITLETGCARLRPHTLKWAFPAAVMAFNPTHWMPMPEPPTDEEAA